MHMVDSKYSLKLKNNHKPENKCIDAKKCQFLFVMQYWRMNCGTLSWCPENFDAQWACNKMNLESETSISFQIPMPNNIVAVKSHSSTYNYRQYRYRASQKQVFWADKTQSNKKLLGKHFTNTLYPNAISIA